jgi:pyruvate dehydrogenase E1 component
MQDIDDFDNERQEWIDSLEAFIDCHGKERTVEILDELEEHAKARGVIYNPLPYSPYRNTISLEEQPVFPGDLRIEERVTSILRWNALVMVMRANEGLGDVGGHVASYASAAEIFEMGFNHFFQAGDTPDLVYYQPHSAPGIYSRAYLEGRLSKENLKNYRKEVGGKGLCSYPHPWLMPDFWQFPTGSMGLGPISAIHNARFMRYLQHRDLLKTEGRHVWGVFGDGEMDEPESTSALPLAAREKLDNLTFVINCNLQRLDGPVRGNSQIIQELEATFRGAGWNVIKVLWSSNWDELFSRDTNHVLLRRFSETVDGKYQTLGAKDGAYNLKHFFAEDPEIAAIVSHMSDEDIDALKRGGHDFRKLYAAFKSAKEHKGQPTVILAKTKKGFGLGHAGESRMNSHQTKKLDIEGLKAFRDRFSLPLTDEEVESVDFYRPDEDSEELEYLRAQRERLGGYLPARVKKAPAISVPALDRYAKFAMEANGKEMSSTMAIVRMLGGLLRDKNIGPRIVPIVADEARTFGMASLFRQIGIYSPVGQLYEPEDASSILSYKEATDGQLLEEGITEAGAMSSWIAAATSYGVHKTPMLPFYIYYSMFGFQRIGDLIWAAADQRARGFLIGATAGKTTLNGEGLQHQDGISHLVASTVPNCRAYDPCYAYEVAIIFHHGTQQMMGKNVDEFYYLTVMNESYAHPTCPEGVEDDLIKGLYSLVKMQPKKKAKARIRLLGSGTILREVEAAGKLLVDDWDVEVEILSATSFSELERNGRHCERYNRLHPEEDAKISHISKLLQGTDPVIAATDYVRGYPQLIAPYVNASFKCLGTDGFGRSDARDVLRRFFEIDRHQIVLAALDSLSQEGKVDRKVLKKAIDLYGISVDTPDPWTI